MAAVPCFFVRILTPVFDVRIYVVIVYALRIVTASYRMVCKTLRASENKLTIFHIKGKVGKPESLSS